MRVALVHDYLQDYGDLERSLMVLHRLYPAAPIYTAFVDWSRLRRVAPQMLDWDLRPTIAQRLPGICQKAHFYRRWAPYFWESLDLGAYDLVISLGASYLSHGVLTRATTLHVAYCYTPARDLWAPIAAQATAPIWQVPTAARLRQYDGVAAQRVDRFVAASEPAARRIRKFYRRSPEVIYPPVPVAGEGKAGNEYYLYVGALEREHRVDQAIAACQRLNRPLWIAGTGSELPHLQRLATPSVRFLGAVAPDRVAELYRGAIALIYPTADEDFAFAPVEAMGYGVPVIACAQSGLRDVVLDYRTGLLFPESSVERLCAAIAQFEQLRFSANACIQRAEEFAESVFISKFEWFIAKALDDHQSHGAIVEPLSGAS